jgi:predicted ATP-grasp superfamily ATP-dependent carboligase
MAENRFKKSVDAATSNTVDSAKENAPEPREIKADGENSNILYNTLYNISSNIKYNILESVEAQGKKGNGSSHTFYLSAEVAEELRKLSKRTKQSKSALVNGILKAVFAEGKETGVKQTKDE